MSAVTASLLFEMNGRFPFLWAGGEPPSARRALEAKRAYERFLDEAPDMPSEHRRRFRSQIDRCGREARRLEA